MPPGPTGQQPLCMLDLKIYHEFMFNFGNTMRLDRQSRDMIRGKLVDLANNHDYVLHNCLALSALQLFHKCPTEHELWERACHLQGIAIEQVQPILVSMTLEDAIPSLIFASNTAAFSRLMG
ncbi:hypothetical protein E4T39_02059 [Aureobasidium subglaciale]|nr:hypothetical protein E4T39_02059 [Aureobasidium subglaciale]